MLDAPEDPHAPDTLPSAPAAPVPGSSIPPTSAYIDTDDVRFDHGWSLSAPLTSLDPRETSRGPIGPTLSSTDFRHSFWRDRRPRMRRALQNAGAPAHRLTAWDRCGSCAWILLHPEHPGRARLVCHRCHDRFCEACQAERRRRVCRNLQDALTTRYRVKHPHTAVPRLRFLTLTLRSSTAPLREQLDRLYSCFGRFRHRKAIQRVMQGGISFLELTLNPRTRLFHPHLHILFEGDYLPQKVASDTWKSVTEDSYIVDIRAIKTIAQACSYVAKYASKGIGPSVLNSPNHLTESIEAVSGRRIFNTFGSWSQLGLTDQPPPEDGWYPIGTFADLQSRRHAGDPAAIRIFRILSGENPDEPLDHEPTARNPSAVPPLCERSPP